MYMYIYTPISMGKLFSINIICYVAKSKHTSSFVTNAGHGFCSCKMIFLSLYISSSSHISPLNSKTIIRLRFGILYKILSGVTFDNLITCYLLLEMALIRTVFANH